MLWIGVILVVLVAGGFLATKKVLTSKHDYSKMGWLEAFDELHSNLVVKYPFTEWKGIDWEALYAQTAPAIAAAEAEQDVEAYYLALRRYAYAIPDGQVALAGEDFGLRQQAIGGGYGFAIIELDDGRVIAHILLEDGPAAQAGMQWGAEILTWNGLPIQQALEETATLWADTPQATREGKRLEQLRYLVRAEVGTPAEITFRNPEGATQTTTLTAEDDQLQTLNLTLPPEKEISALVKSPIQTEILPGQVGYIRITSFMPNLTHFNAVKSIERALQEFIAQGVTGIIIDVRNNGGGLDAWVPQIAAHFYTQPGFYEYVTFYTAESGDFQIDDRETLAIDPAEPYFAGPVVVLVDEHSASTAEGLPLSIQPLAQGYVAGIHGTNGSFAMGNLGDDLYRLPEGLAFNFLAGRSLNANMEIQVDGDAAGNGGVVPDLRVPLTEESVYALYIEGEDIVLQAALEKIGQQP